MIIQVRSSFGDYPIHISEQGLSSIGEKFDLDKKVLIVTDDGVPERYSEIAASQCLFPTVVRVPQGEGSKSVGKWKELLETMLREGFTRKDCVIALGGGVCGDLAGFTAACYMRGIDFYNIPTTVLSQVDSSVGGKTAVNLDGIKNAVGAFYPPKGVLIDCTLLKTLPPRQIANGLSEAVKMALTFDAELFEKIEKNESEALLPEIVERSLLLKKKIVEEDELESGLRRVLNFGHTIGHGIESVCPSLYHGECVALGMLPVCSESVRNRLLPVLDKLGLPTVCRADRESVYRAILHDKKTSSGGIDAVFVDEIGKYRTEKITAEKLMEKYDDIYGESL